MSQNFNVSFQAMWIESIFLWSFFKNIILKYYKTYLPYNLMHINIC